MPQYTCPRCNNIFKQRGDIRRHFLRKRPCRIIDKNISLEQCFIEVLGENIHSYVISKKQVTPSDSKMTPSDSKMTPNDSKMTPIDSKMTPIDSKMTPQVILSKKGESQKIYKCKFCEKTYSKNSNLHRHMKTCKFKCEQTTSNSDSKDLLILELIKEKEQMRKSIDKLLDRVGNVTNNITNQQNVFINTHGHENLSYINGDYLNNLLKIPYAAVPKLLKDIHFHPEHPENMNVKITNKKESFVKVWEGDRWKIKDKKKVIENMIDKGFNIIDGQYTTIKKILEPSKKKKYIEFQEKYDSSDKQLMKNLHKDTEFMVINNS